MTSMCLVDVWRFNDQLVKERHCFNSDLLTDDVTTGNCIFLELSNVFSETAFAIGAESLTISMVTNL